MPAALLVVLTLGVLGLAVGLYVVVAYNRLVGLRERYKNAFAQIDVQLKRRYDLIPNLVEAVRGYMAHERDTLERVIQARNQAVAANRQAAADPADATAVTALSGAEGELTAVLGRLFMLREDYPDLKADTQTSRLMEELSSTENRIAFARQHYNDSVMTYNTNRQSVPAVFVAQSLGFEDAALFEVHEPAAREAVRVSLGSSDG